MSPKFRNVRKTVLVVGEGDTEVAFLKHLRTVYCANNQGAAVTVSNAHGKNPLHVIETVKRYSRSMAFDRKVALLDTDVAWSPAVQKEIRLAKICAIGTKPCIEGLYLAILGRKIPLTTQQCKEAASMHIAADLLDWHAYAPLFSKEILENVRGHLPELDLLLSCFEGTFP